MELNYKNFLRVLNNLDCGVPTLFEPEISRDLTEHLIWRRGSHLWNSPESYIETVISLRNIIFSDIAIADFKSFTNDEKLTMSKIMNDSSDESLRYVAICHSENDYEIACKCRSVCACAVTYEATRYDKPLIFMFSTPDNAIKFNADGWYAPDKVESYYKKFENKISILGGLGKNDFASAKPLKIHERVSNLITISGSKGIALGTGFPIDDSFYLQFISLLAANKKFRDKRT